MSDEIVYANLQFQDSDKKENIQETDKCGEKVLPAPSYLWRKTVWILSFLCLLLLVGLGVLGGTFYAMLKTQMVKSDKLQISEEELQRNVSLQLMHNRDRSMEIRRLSATLQRLATALCQELQEKDPEHRCKPCPKSATWYKESCYSRLDGFHSWKNSEMLCSARNASLLTIKNRSTLEFIKSKKLRKFWLGLSPRHDYTDYTIVDEKIFSSEWFKRNSGDLSTMYCGYLDGMYAYYSPCSEEKYVMCVHTASEVKVANVLTSDIPEGSL